MLGEALEMVTQGLEIPIIDLNSVAIITDVSTTNTSPNVFGMTLDLVVIFKEMGIDGSVLPPPHHGCQVHHVRGLLGLFPTVGNKP